MIGEVPTLAGFRPLARPTRDVIETSHAMDAPSLAALWESMRRSNAPVELLERDLGTDRWATLQAGVLARLEERFGTGPQRVTMIANLGVGRR